MILRIFLATLLTLVLIRSTALSGDTAGPQNAESKTPVSVFEGILKIHPKYLWKYYVTGFAQGQLLALFGDEILKDIKPGSIIHVEGRLGTRLPPRGDEKNPPQLSGGWYIYMDVESVKVLREPEVQGTQTAPSPPPGASNR